MRTTFLFVILCFTTLTFTQEKAPDFTLKNLEGEDVSLSDFAGKVVVLEWYATWCTKCRGAFPEFKPFFNRLIKEYAEKDVVVIAINLDKKDPEKLAKFVEKQGIEYLTLTDPEGITGKSYSLKMLPLIIVVDKEGAIAEKITGYKKGKTIKQIEKSVLSLTSQSE